MVLWINYPLTFFSCFYLFSFFIDFYIFQQYFPPFYLNKVFQSPGQASFISSSLCSLFGHVIMASQILHLFVPFSLSGLPPYLFVHITQSIANTFQMEDSRYYNFFKLQSSLSGCGQSLVSISKPWGQIFTFSGFPCQDFCVNERRLIIFFMITITLVARRIWKWALKAVSVNKRNSF